ncbi:ABC-F family ATP-binding cassette domain-containing protein [Pollutibacter soli]|uniref:ABC-F family ATP-binding cassette domain-containing protein n=1 Tax=Pollutibacter soli TaxID=3034157 RepID=UPI003013A7AA
MISIRDLVYSHPDKNLIFNGINLNINAEAKMSLMGNNGSGKSTLLKIISGELESSSGIIKTSVVPWLVPQLFGQYNNLTVAQALRVDKKLQALNAITEGNVAEHWLDELADDWMIEERCNQALQHWRLDDIKMERKFSTLSGGQKTKVFLAGIDIHQPELILLDEPGNHLDYSALRQLQNMITNWQHSLLLVSHDRKLLNLVSTTLELSSQGVKVYGGNYQFYSEQKKIERSAYRDELKEKEKALRKAKATEREASERQYKLNARGKSKQARSGVPTIMMNTLRNNAEKTAAKLKGTHEEKRSALQKEVNELTSNIPANDQMKIGLTDSYIHRNKVLVKAENMNHSYDDIWMWCDPLNFIITAGERIAISGDNGSGKTTLISIIRGDIKPDVGNIVNAATEIICIDQEYSLINKDLTVFQQAVKFNHAGLLEHEINIRLSRFLLGKEFWNKSCSSLSGGERMRLILCCLTMAIQSPDIIILDEPTNNLDLQNLEILSKAINEYKGTLIVVSHDEYFLNDIGIQRTIALT